MQHNPHGFSEAQLQSIQPNERLAQFQPGAIIDIHAAEGAAAGLPPAQPDPQFFTPDHGERDRHHGKASIVPVVAQFATAPAISGPLDHVPVAIIASEAVQFSVQHADPHFELTRAPEGAGNVLTGGRFLPMLPGLYVVTAHIAGGWRRDIVCAVYPGAVMAQLEYLPRQVIERRRRLRAVTREIKVDRIAEVLDGCAGAVDFRRLLGLRKNSEFNPRSYG